MEQLFFIINNPLWGSVSAILTSLSILIPVIPYLIRIRRPNKSNRYETIVIIKPPGRTLTPLSLQGPSPSKAGCLINIIVIFVALYGMLFSFTFIFLLPHETNFFLFLVSIPLFPFWFLLLILRIYRIIRNE